MNIYEAINAIMTDLGPIGKDKKNQQQGFMYRGIDDVMNALQPIMTKHGVFAVPEVIEHTREDRKSNKGNSLIYSIIKMKYIFYSTDGTCVSATVIGEGMDSGDKASNKAMSIAFKYACFQVFCIPTEETHPEPDAVVQPPSNPAPKPNAFDSAKVKTIEEIIKGSKLTMVQVIKSCQRNFNKSSIEELTDAEFAELTSNISKVVDGK